MRDFEAFFAQATGYQPYGYQERLAKDGLPDAWWAPTGTGKTGLILAWLWRRLHGPDRAATPRRLVYALPQRAVLDEVPGRVRTWLENLGLTDEVALHVVLGDRGTSTGDWRENMHQPAIVVGTAETLVSKALLRGYGVGSAMHPVDFALVTNGAQWIIDEAGFCPTATMTLRQLAGWAGEWGTAEPFFLTCLSSLGGGGGSAGETIAPQERTGELAVRLSAVRTIRRAAVVPGDYRALGDIARARHRAGTTTLVVLNTVPAAQELYRGLRGGTVACTLLHSQFRGVERVARLADIAASPADRIVVATGDIAATLDLSAAVLVTEAAPWASLVCRAGRCNRTGTVPGAEAWWVPPAAPASAAPGLTAPGPAERGPAERLAVDAACAELSRLEGVAVTGEDLAARGVFGLVDQVPGLGLAEFSALFDTSPASSGPEVDVARYVCDAADLDVDVAWVTWTPGPDGAPDPEVRYPGPEYRCRVPIEQAIKLAASRPVWRFDHEAGQWRRAAGDPGWRPRPFELLLVNAAVGGYDPSTGFDLASWTPVAGSPELLTPDEIAERAAAEAAALGTDPLVAPARPWQSLDEHSQQVRDQCAALLTALKPAISPEAAQAAVVAAYAHDAGKAHPIWQDALCALAAPGESAAITAGRPWAKSGTTGALRFAGGVSFRHELASVLLIDGPLRDIIAAIPEKDLARYLVLAHHGQLRMRVGDRNDLAGGQVSVQSVQKDTEITSEILGLKQGTTSDIPSMLGHKATTLTVDLAQFAPDGTRSWTNAVAALRDRFGPFILAYLETVVRVADWRGSGARELATNTDAIDIRAKVPRMGDTSFAPPLKTF